MKAEARSQKQEARIENRTKRRFAFARRGLIRGGVALLASCFLILASAQVRAATHVTGTYDLGSNSSAMTTVNGTPEYGLIFVQRNKLVTYGGVQYGTQVFNGYLDANGHLNDGAGNLWLDLIPNTTASPSDSYFVVTVNIQGTVHSEIWVVPDTATVDVALVRQAQPTSSAAPALFYQFVQHSGSDLPQRTKLNLSGSGVSCADNAASLSTDCSFSGTGGGSAPLASATTSGTVKTDSTDADPVVYLKTSADSLLAGKANVGHAHAESDVTNLVSDLAGKVPATRTVSTTAPLSGGGALSSNLTLSIPAASGSQNGYLSSGDWSIFNAKESALTFSSPLSRSVNTISCPTCEVTANKNAASGYAGLTASSKLNASQGQEVWSVTDLTTYASASGTGTAAIQATITSPASNDVLTWNGTNWINQAPSGGSNHNLLSATHSDTAAASPVLGDLLYANSTPAWTKLAGNTTSTKKYLAQTGNGSVSAAPVWAQVAAADVSGLAASATTDTTSASNISSGTLPAARLPNPGATTKGGVQSKDCTGTGHVLSINTDSTVTCSADASAGGGASTADSFVTISHDADLTGERVLTAGSGISITDGGANGSATIAFNPVDSTTFWMHEEFCGGIPGTSGSAGESGFTISLVGTSGVTGAINTGAVLPNPCVIRLTTSAITARGGSLNLSSAGNGALFGTLGSTANNWDAKFTFATDATASTSLYIGFSGSFASIPPANFIGLRLDTSATSPSADSAFRFVVCKASICSAHATAYTADTSFHTIRIRSTASGQVALTFDANAEICFNSGGTGGCTSSANVPTAAVTAQFELVNEAGAAQHLDCDFFGFLMTGLSR